MRFRVPPVHINDEVEVEIIGKGKKEDGVAKIEDYIIFIPGVNVGDKLKVKITKVLPKFAFAEQVGKVTKAEKPAEAKQEEPEPTETEPAQAEPETTEAKPEEEKPEPAKKPAKPKAKPKAEKKAKAKKN